MSSEALRIIPAKELGLLSVKDIFTQNDVEMPDTKNTLVLNLYNREHREQAGDLLTKGHLIAIRNGPVMGIWLNASSPDAINRLYDFKGHKRIDMTVGMTVSWEQVISDIHDQESSWIDTGKVHPGFVQPVTIRSFRQDNQDVCVPLIQSPRDMRILFNENFVRLPLKPSKADKFPSQMVSKTSDGQKWVQIWDTKFSPPIASMMRLAIEKGGIGSTGVTSFNKTGQPEITDTVNAIRTAEEGGISAVLIDPLYPLTINEETPSHILQGSFPGVIITERGVIVFRRGQMEQTRMQVALENFGIPVIYEEVRRPNHSVLPVPETYPHDMREYRRARIIDCNLSWRP